MSEKACVPCYPIKIYCNIFIQICYKYIFKLEIQDASLSILFRKWISFLIHAGMKCYNSYPHVLSKLTLFLKTFSFLSECSAVKNLHTSFIKIYTCIVHKWTTLLKFVYFYYILIDKSNKLFKCVSRYSRVTHYIDTGKVTLLQIMLKMT